MQRLNQNLAFELGNALDELDALKRTVVDSNRPSIKAQNSEDEPVLPSFMRVMDAEQTLYDNFVYENEQLSSNLQRNLTAMIPVIAGGKRRHDDSDEIEAENENSIP